MEKHVNDLLTKEQRQLLKQFLSLVDNKEVFNLTELEGFLFGLVITPDLIPINEWMPVIFGEDAPVFKSEKQIDLLFKSLIDLYNAYSDAFHNGTLKFPFVIEKAEDISDEFINETSDWAYGLLNALRLRPEVWYLDYDFKDAPEEIQEVLLSFAIIHGVVYPEDARYLFRTKNGELSDENLNTALLFTFLPLAVETLKKHGERLWKIKIEEMNKEFFDFNQKKVKIGRNDPCPCGSGKKYKKCCGKN